MECKVSVLFFKCRQIITSLSLLVGTTVAIDVSKINENRCKQTLASLPCFLGMQLVSDYSYNESTTEFCICTW